MKLIKCLVAGCIVGVISATVKGEEKNHNFFVNPGFENNFMLTVKKWYKPLLATDVTIGNNAEKELMPKGVILISSNRSKGTSLKYVSGEAGKEVHSGKYAIQIISKGKADFMIGAGWPSDDNGDITPDKELFSVWRKENIANNALQHKKKYSIAVYAKGNGVVYPNLYAFDNKTKWLGGPKDSKGVPLFLIDSNIDPKKSAKTIKSKEWKKYSWEPIEITSDQVGKVRIVLFVKGDVSIDDISLLAFVNKSEKK